LATGVLAPNRTAAAIASTAPRLAPILRLKFTTLCTLFQVSLQVTPRKSASDSSSRIDLMWPARRALCCGIRSVVEGYGRQLRISLP
jgi:hypothetical protein